MFSIDSLGPQVEASSLKLRLQGLVPMLVGGAILWAAVTFLLFSVPSMIGDFGSSSLVDWYLSSWQLSLLTYGASCSVVLLFLMAL